MPKYMKKHAGTAQQISVMCPSWMHQKMKEVSKRRNEKLTRWVLRWLMIGLQNEARNWKEN